VSALSAGIGQAAEVEAQPVPAPPALGSFSALAESSWMGAAQSTEVLDQVRAAGQPAALPRRRAGLLGRELTIAQATVVLAASFFASALLGAVRQVLFNAEFGAGNEASAYYAAFRLPDTLFSLVAGGALSSAMIPVLLATSRTAGVEAAGRLTSLVLTSLLACFAALVLVAELAAPVFVPHVLAPGFDGETSDLTVRLTRIMLLQPLILAAGSVAIAVLNSRNRFLLTALSITTHNIALIAGIVAAMLFPSLGIYGPALGVVAGGVMQALIVLPGLRDAGAKLRPAWDLHDPGLRETARLLLPNGLTVGVAYSGFIADTAFASKASEPSGLPAVHNAWLLVGLPIALIGQALGQAAFPRLAAHAASFDWERMRRTLVRALVAVVALAVPAVAGIFVLGRFTIRVLFEHGEFDASAGDVTHDVLVVYALALPACLVAELVTRGLIALRDTQTPLLTNSVQALGRIAIVAALLDSQGVVAIPIAFAATASVEAVVLAAVLARKLRNRLGAAAAVPA
jgi:putative peptidoglycan lipid II flippase